MKTVYKFPLSVGDNVTNLSLPKGAEFLHCAFQYNTPCLWVLLDPGEEETEGRTVVYVGTGHRLHDGRYKFINTAFTDQVGTFVFHFFEWLP